MYIKTLLTILAIFLTVSTSFATVRTLVVEFSFTKPEVVQGSRQLIGYKLYKEGEFVCSSYKADNFIMNCRVDITKNNTPFTMTAYYSDGTESPQSPIKNFVYQEVNAPTGFIIAKNIENSDKKLVTLKLTVPAVANVIGYNVYANNILICKDRNIKDFTVNCLMDITGKTTFALTQVFTDNTESSFSNTITYSP